MGITRSANSIAWSQLESMDMVKTTHFSINAIEPTTISSFFMKTTMLSHAVNLAHSKRVKMRRNQWKDGSVRCLMRYSLPWRVSTRSSRKITVAIIRRKEIEPM